MASEDALLRVEIEFALVNLMLVAAHLDGNPGEASRDDFAWLAKQTADVRFAFGRLMDRLDDAGAAAVLAIETSDARWRQTEARLERALARLDMLAPSSGAGAGSPEADLFPEAPIACSTCRPAAPDNVVRLPVTHCRPQLFEDPS